MQLREAVDACPNCHQFGGRGMTDLNDGALSTATMTKSAEADHANRNDWEIPAASYRA